MSALPDWAARVRRIHAAAGLLVLHVIRAGDAPGLMAAAHGGDKEAARLLMALDHASQGIAHAPANAPMECACCHTPLRQGRYCIVVGLPATPAPADALCLAICQRCGPTLGGMHAAAARALRDLWPDSRPLTVTHPNGGRA